MDGPTPHSPDIAKRIGQYVALRDRIKEIEDKHDQELKPYKAAKEQLEGVFMTHLNTTGGDSVAVKGVGTIYRTTKKSASLADAEQFRRFVIGGEHWDIIDWKANVSAVEAFLEDHKQLPPGVNFSQRDVVGVRRA